jgi:hypothetical protein
MIEYPSSRETTLDNQQVGLVRMVTTAIVLAFGISIVAAAVLVAVGMLLER